MEKQGANTSHCKMLILDEADKVLSQDFKGMRDKDSSCLPRPEGRLERSLRSPRPPIPERLWGSRRPASLWWWCPG